MPPVASQAELQLARDRLLAGKKAATRMLDAYGWGSARDE